MTMVTSAPATQSVRTVWQLLGVVMVMFLFGYALVPLYNVMCEWAGIKSATRVVSVNDARAFTPDKNRLITIEFVATTHSDLAWQFKPIQALLQVHPGEIYTTHYVATNLSQEAITGQAVPSVNPAPAGNYFSKTECFCFTQQRLEAGETKEMPVRFVVDPHLPADVTTLTLSYTFFRS